MLQYKKVAFYTLGCKLNFAETSTIARQMTDAGYGRVEFEEDPDIFVINTCSVTDNADKKCRSIVRRARRINPDATVVVIGCYAQLKPAEIAEIPGVNLVLGANEKFNVAEHVEQLETGDAARIAAGEIKQVRSFIPGYSINDRTRTFLKVQDGCNYFCAFCTIPLARGRSRSASVAETLEVAREIAAGETREVVLTGVNIGDFGQGSNETFSHLVQELDTLDGIDRLRISSIEPNLLSNEIIDFVAESQKFVPHFHIPLQSGSDKILKMMRRRYLRELYASRVAQIKAKMPDACIGADVIVGFPGETEEDFLETYNFLKDLEVSYLHVFTYSERNNTTALRINDVVPMEVRHERSRRLRILSEKKKRHFYSSQEGKTATVLFEADHEDGFMYGFTENYVKVKVPYQPGLVNALRTVKLTRCGRDGTMEVEFETNLTTAYAS